MSRRSLINLSLTLATILVFFFGIEFALRVTGIDKGRPQTPPIYEKSSNPDVSYELKPDLHENAFRSTVVTDRRGFRSPEISVSKPTIALLGDSITFGYGLENDQTLGARLDHLLDGKFNVVTAAAPGYTLEQEAAFYTEKVELIHPGTLILVFYWNDLTDTKPAVLDDEGNLQAPGWTSSSPACHPAEDGILGMIPGRCWLDLHSAFYRTVKKIVSARTEQKNLQEQETSYRENAFEDGVTVEQLDQYEQTLQVFSKNLPKDMRRLFIIWPEKMPHLLTIPKLTAIAEKQGFTVLDLYEIFGNKPESLTWDTVHPSAKTVDEAASVVKSALEEWKLLPTL